MIQHGTVVLVDVEVIVKAKADQISMLNSQPSLISRVLTYAYICKHTEHTASTGPGFAADETKGMGGNGDGNALGDGQAADTNAGREESSARVDEVVLSFFKDDPLIVSSKIILQPGIHSFLLQTRAK